MLRDSLFHQITSRETKETPSSQHALLSSLPFNFSKLRVLQNQQFSRESDQYV